MNTHTIWHNGVFKKDEPVLTIHDRIRLGEGVFNTVLVRDGVPAHLERHMKKLCANMAVFLPAESMPAAEMLIEAAHELITLNECTAGHYALNTWITGGPGRAGLRYPETPAPQTLMRIAPCPASFPPAKAVIAQTVRRNEGSPLSRIKCSQYGDNILALQEAHAQGANEAILLNNAGHVCCATTANIVALIDDDFITPPVSDGVQDGITRSVFMMRYEVQERSLTPADLKGARALYLLNSLRGALPVVSLDGVPVPCDGPVIPQYFHLD